MLLVTAVAIVVLTAAAILNVVVAYLVYWVSASSLFFNGRWLKFTIDVSY